MAGTTPLIARLGWRNLGYVVFVLGCVGYGILHQTQFLAPDVARMGVGIGIGLAIWAIGTAPFLLWNAMALVLALSRGRAARPAAIGVALPVLVMLVGWPLIVVLEAWLVPPPHG